MTLVLDEDDNRPRVLSNTGVLAYITRHWLREPVRFAFIWVLIVTGAVCDLTIPWATRGLMQALDSPVRVSAHA